jgi:hypothetical protein
VRHREDPLAHGYVGREHVIVQRARGLCELRRTANGGARGAPRREGDESFAGTVSAPGAREAPRQQTAAQEFPELVDDQPGKAAAVRLCVHRLRSPGWRGRESWRPPPSRSSRPIDRIDRS